MVLPELQKLASGMGISGISKMRKGDLIAAIKERQGGAAPTSSAPKAESRPAESRPVEARQADVRPADAPTSGTADAPAERQDRARQSRTTDADGERGNGRTSNNDRQGSEGRQNDSRTDDGDNARQGGRNNRQNDNRQGDNRTDDGDNARQGGRNNRQNDNRGNDNRQNDNRQNDSDGDTDDQSSNDRQNNRGNNNDRQNNRDNNRGNDNDGARDNNRGGNNNRNDRYDDDDDNQGGRGRRRRRGRDRNNRNDNRGGNNSRGNNRNDRGNDRYDEPQVSEDDVLVPIAGILDILDNYAFVRTSGYLTGSNDVYVSLSQVRKYSLRRGDAITGAVKAPREGERREKFNALVRLDSINGLEPEQAKNRPEFTKLTPLYPQTRLRLETEPNILTTRIIDLVMPIGKGQRALVVSPPKAGKTSVLQAIANAITVNNPECHLMVVLVDERPEEVTDMQRSVKGEVVSSTFDEPATRHVQVLSLIHI